MRTAIGADVQGTVIGSRLLRNESGQVLSVRIVATENKQADLAGRIESFRVIEPALHAPPQVPQAQLLIDIPLTHEHRC